MIRMVRNSLIRTLTRSSHSVSTSQLLCNLHWDWLPIHKPIPFKVATYKVTKFCLLNNQLISITSCLTTNPVVYFFSCQFLLHIPRIKTDFGRRAFSAASQIWNYHIPTAIRVSPSLDSFKPPQNSLLCLTITVHSPLNHFPAPLIYFITSVNYQFFTLGLHRLRI